MVILNGLKYACETCIKGHRSSACSHTDRTLFEIKKKGRPITQCEHCRHLRKTRQVHVKCLCGTRSSNEKSNGARAKLKLPASATIRLDPEDPTHATITAGPGLLPPKTKVVKPKYKSKECCKPAESKSCNNARPSSPSLSSGPVTPPPPSAAPTTSSCCSTKTKSHPPDNPTSNAVAASSTSNEDNYTASLLDDLSRSAARSTNTAATAAASASATHDPYHHHVQPFYNPNLSANSFAWQSGVNLGSCSCGITCACPGCYEHSLSTSMILFSGENCPYSCTTCTACNGFGVTPHMPNAFILPTHSNDHWRQPSSSAIVSTAPFNPTPASSSSSAQQGPEKSTAPVSRCCGGPCRCIVCNCDKAKDGEDIPPERISFAVSGERGGCCTDANPRIRRYSRPPDDHEANSSSSVSSEMTAVDVVDGDRDSTSRDRPAAFSMQGNPTITQIQMHSIDVPKLVA